MFAKFNDYKIIIIVTISSMFLLEQVSKKKCFYWNKNHFHVSNFVEDTQIRYVCITKKERQKGYQLPSYHQHLLDFCLNLISGFQLA